MFSRTTGQARLALRPSKKSIQRVVEKVHDLTVRARTWQETTELVGMLTRLLRGWANYFSVGIRAVCSQFVVLCRQLGLFTRAVVALDGSKFKAVNNRDKNYTVAKVTGRMEQVDASIARYLRALDRADREEGDVAEAKSVRLKEKIAGLRRQMQAMKAMEQTVRLDRMPEAMGVRRQTVEHPFGTLKAWMGATHFLTRT